MYAIPTAPMNSSVYNVNENDAAELYKSLVAYFLDHSITHTTMRQQYRIPTKMPVKHNTKRVKNSRGKIFSTRCIRSDKCLCGKIYTVLE